MVVRSLKWSKGIVFEGFFLGSFGELVQAMALSSFLAKIFEGFQAALEMLGWLLGHLAVILTAWLVGVGSLE